MRAFWLGFILGVIALLLAAFVYVRFGFIDPRADIRASHLERDLAMPSLDAAVGRRAPDLKNPVQPNDANLIAGMTIYQANCAVCHGDIRHPHGRLAGSLNPRAPQFVEDPADMPEDQNFYIIQHGIRMSGMPAWKPVLSDLEMWQVTTFLAHMDKLPPQVSERWKFVANGSDD